ncbi:MAG: DUF7687 domain-containing protein [Solirubrobacteraceae bacterium]
MRPIEEFRNQPPEFWALVKLASMQLGYSERGTGRLKRYSVEDIEGELRSRGLDPDGYRATVERVAAYAAARADLLEQTVEPNLMDRDKANAMFERIRERVDPPEYLLTMNKQKKEKRHYAYLACIVNMLTYEALQGRFEGAASFDHNPRGPLTFARDGMPLRTLFRWMDGAYPNVNHPVAAWEIKEYYGTKTFGSRVADGVYETALDGYELNDLRGVGVEVEHFLFLDDYFTWWKCGRSYLCRIVDMLHADLLDGAFFGREVEDQWPAIVAGWPRGRRFTS